jgi:aminoglycoside 3-N-acetyltransferase
MVRTELQPVTRNELEADLRKLGVRSGDTIMLHASVKAIGWIVGGPDVVIETVLGVLGRGGTLMMYVAWEEDGPYRLARLPSGWQKIYLRDCPPFDPARSRARRHWSILTEYLRTWPGAYRSGNPEASCVAVGARARWLTQNHPLQYGYGRGSPLARLTELKGRVLLLGSPLGSISLLHYAESIADVPNKRVIHYQVPILRHRKREWVEIEEFDTGGNVLPNAEQYFDEIPRKYLASGKGTSGKVGTADSYLLEAADFVDFAVQWLEREYGQRVK